MCQGARHLKAKQKKKSLPLGLIEWWWVRVPLSIGVHFPGLIKQTNIVQQDYFRLHSLKHSIQVEVQSSKVNFTNKCHIIERENIAILHFFFFSECKGILKPTDTMSSDYTIVTWKCEEFSFVCLNIASWIPQCSYKYFNYTEALSAGSHGKYVEPWINIFKSKNYSSYTKDRTVITTAATTTTTNWGSCTF